MSGAFDQFVGSLAFVVLAISLWAQASVWYRRALVGYENLCLGTVAGGMAIGSILLAVEPGPGFLPDLRYAPILIAALFGGPLAAGIAALAAITFCLVSGGVEALGGAILIAAVAGIGVVANLRSRSRSQTLRDVMLTTVAMGLTLTGALLLVPGRESMHDQFATGLLVAALNCFVAIVCGVIMVKTRDSELERSILVTAFTQAPDYLYVKDRDSRFVIVNENMLRIHGRATTDEMRGLSDFDTMERSRAEELYRHEQHVMHSGIPLVDSLEQMADRFYLASKVPVRNAQGRVIGLAGVTREITDRVTLERELRESKNLLTYAMEGMSDGFAMFDSQGFLVFCNAQYRNAFPLSADARVVGAHIRDILHRVIETQERMDIPSGAAEEWIETATAKLHSNNDEDIQLPNGDWRSLKTRLADDGTAMVVVSDITVMKHAEIALRLSADQMKNLAETDGLTGIANRRAFDEALAREVVRGMRQNTQLSLLMIDIDRFKAFNDTYGHPAGDRCLRLVGKCLSAAVKRPTDVIARYGGEEFVALLPDTTPEAANAVAEQFTLSLHRENIIHSECEFGELTASIGIATAQCRSLDGEPEYLLEAADDALYDAKKNGRNRIVSRRVAARALRSAGN